MKKDRMVRKFDLFKGENLEFDDSCYIWMLYESVYKFAGFNNISLDGILIRSYSIGDRVFELRLDGIAEIKSTTGEEIDTASYLMEYYKKGGQEEIEFSKIPILKLFEIGGQKIYHGVFYNISDVEHYLALGKLEINHGEVAL